MRTGRHHSLKSTRVVVLTADAVFDESARATFGASSAIDLTMVTGSVATQGDKLDLTGATVAVIDLDANDDAEMAALSRLMSRVGAWPPVIAVTQSFDENVARTLLQMRVADFLVKPVAPIDLVRACARVVKGQPGAEKPTEAQIYTFLPAVGGAGVTTLAIQTAMQLLNSAVRASSRRPVLSISISSMARSPTISISSRGSISAKSSRARSGSTGNSWR